MGNVYDIILGIMIVLIINILKNAYKNIFSIEHIWKDRNKIISVLQF